MNKEEILACYRRGGPETDESTNLHFLPEKVRVAVVAYILILEQLKFVNESRRN